MLYTPIGGYHGSSTRTELAAAIIAILANGPVHIGTDSQAFHDRAQRILSNLRNGKKHKYNWMTKTDGDLWQHFEQAAKAKGPKSIRITKVKGHVTQEQVEQKLYRACDKQGNDQADAAADVAVEMHGKEIVSLAKIWQRRHYRYLTFMLKVAKHIVEAYFIHRELVDHEQQSKQVCNSKVHFQPLQVQTRDNTSNPISKLQLQDDIARYKAFGNKRKASRQFWDFLNSLEYTECSHQYNATSWLELYLLYRCKGFPKLIADSNSKARARATVEMQLREFKNTVRGILQRGLHDEEVQALFKPCKVTHDRFINLGIKGKYPAICASIIFDDASRDIVQQNLITLGHRIPKKEIAKFVEGSIGIKPNLPNFKGRAGWDSNIAMLPQGIAATQQPATCNQQAVELCNATSNTCYMCPRCKHPELSSRNAFQLVDLDTTCKCNHCKVSTKVQDWLCMCHLRWHSCIKHQSQATQAKSKNTPLSKARPVKRSVGPLTAAELQEIDVKRIRKNPPRVLPPAPNLLSINLRELFAHLFNK